jgi:hypothetical protein
LKYLLGSLSDRVCFSGKNRWSRLTLPKQKGKGLLHWQTLGEGRRVYDGPVTKNRAPNTDRKGSKIALSLPKTVDKGLGSSENKVETRFNVGQYKKKRAQTMGMDGG